MTQRRTDDDLIAQVSSFSSFIYKFKADQLVQVTGLCKQVSDHIGILLICADGEIMQVFMLRVTG